MKVASLRNSSTERRLLPNVVVSFKVGPAQDLVNVGVAVQQSKFDYTLEATDCSDRNSGSSRCGQEFGIGWSAEEKKALIEYLKALLNPLFRQFPALLGAGTVGISRFNRPPRPG
jgi:hypothetical protein